MDDFSQVVQRVTSNVISCLESGAELEVQLTREADAVCIKSVESRVLASNRAYEKMFADEKSTLGRASSSYLNASVQKVSEQSDVMLMDGCHVVQFDHIGHDSLGRDVRFRTHKRSLLGMGHPTMAILSITRVLEVIGNADVLRLRGLKDHWRMFCSLDDFDRQIAIGLGCGESVSNIAKDHSVTKKTIENHRTAILKTLNLDSPISLIKLVVRLQENGFGEFGV